MGGGQATWVGGDFLVDNNDYSIVGACKALGGIVVRCVDLQTGEFLPIPECERQQERPRGREEHGALLTTAHISPNGEKLSGVTLWTEGGLLKAQRSGPYNMVHGGGGKRGQVKIMSRASRRRLLRKIAQTKRDEIPVFVTLTYPDLFPDDTEKWKRDIDCLAKRMSRRSIGGVWRIEYKARLSGDRKGEVAPHFHMLVWGQSVRQLLSWIPKAWYSIVNAGDKEHLEHGFKIENVRTWRGVMSYTAKYITKENEGLIPAGCGRFWGVFGKSFIPWSSTLDIDCPDKKIIQLFRYIRRYMNMKARQMPSMTCFISNPSRWQALISSL